MMWQLKGLVENKEAAEKISNDLEEKVTALSSFEAKGGWRVEAYVPEKIDLEAFPWAEKFSWEEVEEKDWVAENQKDFPPLRMGRYYIYGSHHPKPTEDDQVSLLIDAGMAFGSGEHETTYGCLQAMDQLAQDHTFKNILDMGCGTGILGFCAALTWKAPTLLVDNDPEAVHVAEDNKQVNNVSKATTLISEGYEDPKVKESGPYDLIIANILARPLCEMAGSLAENLQSKGMAILSGILDVQAEGVAAAHAKHGLFLKKKNVINQWAVLTLEKP